MWFAAAGLAAPGNTGLFGGRGPVFLLGVFAPALVALALTAQEEGRTGVTRLLKRIGHWRVGARWYAFAIRYFVLPDSGSTGQSFPAYLLQVIPMSVVLAFIYWKTDGSLLLAMLLHASVNNTTGLVPAAIGGSIAPIAFGGSFVAWATVALSWAVATPLLIRMRRADIRGILTSRARTVGWNPWPSVRILGLRPRHDPTCT